MSWIQVDFSLVRYSPIEGTHYFFDPAYPTAIQFLVNGQWEPWDVGWVKQYACYPPCVFWPSNALLAKRKTLTSSASPRMLKLDSFSITRPSTDIGHRPHPRHQALMNMRRLGTS